MRDYAVASCSQLSKAEPSPHRDQATYWQISPLPRLGRDADTMSRLVQVQAATSLISTSQEHVDESGPPLHSSNTQHGPACSACANLPK